MDKTLINTETEYRKFCFELYKKYGRTKLINSIQDALGIVDQSECWDYNDKNEPIDEQGNVLHDYKCPADLLFNNSVKPELTFPLIAVSYIDSGFDRFGDVSFCFIDFVFLADFKL